MKRLARGHTARASRPRAHRLHRLQRDSLAAAATSCGVRRAAGSSTRGTLVTAWGRTASCMGSPSRGRWFSRAPRRLVGRRDHPVLRVRLPRFPVREGASRSNASARRRTSRLPAFVRHFRCDLARRVPEPAEDQGLSGSRCGDPHGSADTVSDRWRLSAAKRPRCASQLAPRRIRLVDFTRRPARRSRRQGGRTLSVLGVAAAMGLLVAAGLDTSGLRPVLRGSTRGPWRSAKGRLGRVLHGHRARRWRPARPAIASTWAR